ncbi:uncharacterized protein LOC119606976 [Lucilia sericata]|uniref:uncharacterized protein LOC119606976 n=1 Tax=Lucilia sericata TaxID=13632 RepID=UPI0018A7F841|nr:uncharacterized protein LOC119606976 [Lucilia sericata]
MYKIISASFLIALAIVTNGEIQNVEPYNYNSNSNSSLRTEDYINMNRQQYAKVIEEYDIQMEIFKQSYAASLETINIRQDMLVDTLVQTDAELNPLEILSNLSQKCVAKYRPSIPTVSATKTKMNYCFTTASQQLNNMLNIPRNTKTSTESYLKNSFERDIALCKRTYSTSPFNYTMCAIQSVEAANIYIFSSQKNFANQMAVAECSSKANINNALDCSYSVEKEAISAVAEAKTLINKCLTAQDVCKSCNQVFTCSEVHYMKRSEVSYSSRTMDNPFYGRNDIKNCLMLQIQ